VGTARRIARTIFLGSAPSSVVSKTAARGIDRARIILGCLQPGQTSSVFAEALSRYLTTPPATRVRTPRASGSTLAPTCAGKWKIANGASYDKTEVRGKIADVLKKTAFKLCRMLLPGGETKQIEPYHPTAKAV
jgi:predicted AAA+ superfamily ATPase